MILYEFEILYSPANLSELETLLILTINFERSIREYIYNNIVSVSLSSTTFYVLVYAKAIYIQTYP